MKTYKVGDLNLGKFKTEIHTTEDVKKAFKKEKVSLATLIPTAWLWYDNELFDILNESGEGRPDEKFGKLFKILYLLDSESIKEMEQESLSISRTTIKTIKLKYIILKN